VLIEKRGASIDLDDARKERLTARPYGAVAWETQVIRKRGESDGGHNSLLSHKSYYP
jgi:hypothetical protein